ncbi:hypothetical protein L1887_54037 [Cichorium endivia]|nr:hypothetical protein L1887_54037 [Cichorium endivia]
MAETKREYRNPIGPQRRSADGKRCGRNCCADAGGRAVVSTARAPRRWLHICSHASTARSECEKNKACFQRLCPSAPLRALLRLVAIRHPGSIVRALRRSVSSRRVAERLDRLP